MKAFGSVGLKFVGKSNPERAAPIALLSLLKHPLAALGREPAHLRTLARRLERLWAPRVPLDRVIAVLTEVGRGLRRQAVHGVPGSPPGSSVTRPDAPVEVVALRARATHPAPSDLEALPEPERPVVRGPAAVAEPDCTVWVPDGWTAQPGALGAWVIRRDGAS